MKTVLNTQNYNIMANPMFLGESLGLQRYDLIKRPIFVELTDKQLKNFWKHDEVNLTKDRVDYESLTGTERFIFENNLRWQTMTDSMLSRSIHEVSQYVTNPELEICMSTWSFFETIHSRSYTWVLQNITKNPAKFFDSILEDKEIVNRANFIKDSYDKLLGNPTDVKQGIHDAVLSTYITESLSFYISFACTLYFKYRGKLVGNGSIVQLIERDEALHTAITLNIMKYWKQDPLEGFQEIMKANEQKTYDLFALVVENEKLWVDYLFSQGDLVGLNANLLKGYIDWLANNRLTSIGLKKIFDQKNNPIGGWLDTFSDSSRIQAAPQETEIIRYEVGALDKTIDVGAFDDLGDL
jgi:ribonucleoside-diphosphate reductase beta chain